MSKRDGGIGDEEPTSNKTKRTQEGQSRSTDLTHDDYMVGWVCALAKEQTAATVMLDQTHADLPKPPTDRNTYTLGSIGKHNIVIACLPKGNVGTNSAATVATQMIDTFPSIKFGLMVGIGGGIPPQVRLGDVVVSTPVDQYPGVVQWDYGKAEGRGRFRRTGALTPPPTALLTVLTKLETEHKLNGSKIRRYLNELEDRWPSLVPEYTRSETLQDPLGSGHRGRSGWPVVLFILWQGLAFLAHVLGWWAWVPRDRPGPGRGTGTGTGTSRTTVDETNRPRDVRVHYGLVASGNQVIKDAKFRDRLNQSLGGNVLCVDMEAAGLMHDFPCIVIRGICDYADSQKKKDWQEYAATIAAAFAKDLLEHVQPAEIHRERTVKDILGPGECRCTNG
jgi:nucleoside phosphorylase